MKEHSLRIYCESLYQPGEIGIIVEFYTQESENFRTGI